MTPQFMRTIHWSGNGSLPGAMFEEYEEPQKKGKVIRLRNDVDEVIINSECALLLDDLLHSQWFGWFVGGCSKERVSRWFASGTPFESGESVWLV